MANDVKLPLVSGVSLSVGEVKMLVAAMEVRMAQLSRALNVEKDDDVRAIRDKQMDAHRNLWNRLISKEFVV